MKTILIVDDHVLFRQALVSLLERHKRRFRVVGEASTGEEAIAKMAERQAEIVLMDLEMPRMNGLEAISVIRKRFPKTKILALTMYEDERHILKAVRAGVDGYFCKSQPAEKLIPTLLAVFREGHAFPRDIARRALEAMRGGAEEEMREHFTPRELDVLHHLGKGLSNKEIAVSLRIRPKTVKNLMNNIFGKLDVENRTQALLKAVREQYIAMPSS